MLVRTNETNLMPAIAVRDNDRVLIPGILFGDVDLEVAYKLSSSAGWVVLTLVDGTIGTYLASSWKQIESGIYQVGLPDSAVEAGKETLLRVTYGANLPQYDTIEARISIGAFASALAVETGTIYGFPRTLNIGDDYSQALGNALLIYVRDGDGNPVTGINSKLFTDGDFAAELIISQESPSRRVTATVTWVPGSGAIEGYLRVEFTSTQTSRAAPGFATLRLAFTWTGLRVTRAVQAIEWIDRVN